MATGAKASLLESARIVKDVVLPNVRSGLFSKDPDAAATLAAADAHGTARSTLTSIRARHGDPDVLSILLGKIVLVFDGEPLWRVLDESSTTFGSDPSTKKQGMEHFQPRAVTISTGTEWRARRDLNEQVLATGQQHPDAARFLTVVAEEVAAFVPAEQGFLTTTDLGVLLEKITLRVVLGDDARDDVTIASRLSQLMREANDVRGLKDNPDVLADFRAQVSAYLAVREDGSLAARCPHGAAGSVVDPVDQVPHWLFAMKDTLALNLAQAVALLAADDARRAEVEEQVADADLADPDTVDGLRLLGGLLEEAMRAWPTTWLLARRALHDTTLGGLDVPEGTQVLVPNAFNHRDVTRIPDADQLQPARWDGDRDLRFNHLSNGTQVCAGIDLVHLLGRAVLAQLVRRHDLVMLQPRLDVTDLPTTIDPFAVRVALGAR